MDLLILAIVFLAVLIYIGHYLAEFFNEKNNQRCPDCPFAKCCDKIK